MSGQTPSQTVGPFFAYGLTPEAYGYESIAGPDLTRSGTNGDVMKIRGRMLDGEGQGVPDAMIEIWQADGDGVYGSQVFPGFGRSPTADDGSFEFTTIKPGQVSGRGNSLQAPHITVAIFARGMLNHAFTRIYFADEMEANAIDQILQSVPEDRQATLISRRDDDGYRFDIHLQGDQETVFFDA